MINETKAATKLPYPTRVSTKSLGRYARRSDHVGKAAQMELKRRRAKLPPNKTEIMNSLQKVVGQKRSVGADLAKHLRHLSHKSIRVAVNRAAKAHAEAKRAAAGKKAQAAQKRALEARAKERIALAVKKKRAANRAKALMKNNATAAKQVSKPKIAKQKPNINHSKPSKAVEAPMSPSRIVYVPIKAPRRAPKAHPDQMSFSYGRNSQSSLNLK
jgi:hypothetical protein